MAKAKKKSKKRKGRVRPEAEKRSGKGPSTKMNLLFAGLVVLLIAAGVAGAFFLKRGEKRQEAQAGELVDGNRTALCDAIEEMPDEGSDHIDESKSGAPYMSNPPTSGKHWAAQPPDDGFYEVAYPNELLIHALEHGQLVIYYPAGDKEITGKVKDAVKEKQRFLVAVPGLTLPEGKRFAMTAWRKRQLCTDFDLDALRKFQDAFANKGPEQVRQG